MKPQFSKAKAPIRSSPALVAILACLTVMTGPARAADSEDSTIRPGIGVGIVRLGMDLDQIKKTAGNVDGSYTLPGGVQVDYAEWKETPPKESPCLKYFFDAKGKAFQINCAAPVPATAGGISCSSTLAQIKMKYKNLTCHNYAGKDQRIDYFDDSKEGIGFQFVRPDGESPMKLQAIIVHRAGSDICPDEGEKSLAVEAK